MELGTAPPIGKGGQGDLTNVNTHTFHMSLESHVRSTALLLLLLTVNRGFSAIMALSPG